VRNIGVDYAQGYAVGTLEPLVFSGERLNG
jgi:hypothetical protein